MEDTSLAKLSAHATKLSLDTISENTRPVSPTAVEYTTSPSRSITPPPIMKLPRSLHSKQPAHSPHDQPKEVSNPCITIDKNLTALKIPSSCETPSHYTPPSFPETSPSENKVMDADFGKRKKGTRRGTLNPEAKSVLKAWMFSPEHFAHPYPSEEEKEELAAEAGIEVKQLTNWFTNARKRLWQPVLRQSGVEVKNFLSTGRGGARGAKLEVPSNISFVPPNSPPTSPRSASNDDDEPEPHFRFPTESERAVKRRKRDNDDDVECEGGSGDSVDSSDSGDRSSNVENRKEFIIKSGFHEVEILAAKSLLGLHRVYQPVH